MVADKQEYQKASIDCRVPLVRVPIFEMEDKMMKKAFIILSVLVSGLSFPFVKADAGTFVLGAKCWYEATWDSAILDIFDQILTDDLAENGFYNIESDTHIGNGYLAGPVLGYQTSDGVWSFSFAPMVFSGFSQKIVGFSLSDMDLLDIGVPIPVEGNTKVVVDVTRTDYDFAVSYALDHYKDLLPFLEYCKVFMGLKYEKISYDFEITSRVAFFEVTGTDEFDFEVYMPTIGFGVAYPFSQDIVAGIQGGIGVATFHDIDVDNSLAYNVEANVSISPIDKLIIQFGYRYQKFSFDLNSADGKTYSSEDVTYGPTVTLIFTL